MQLSSQKYPNNIRTISGPTNEVRPDDVTIVCDTSSAPVVLTLATIPSNYWSTQYKLSVVDGNNNAATNSITINAPSGQTINGLSSFVINTNKGVATISIASNGAYLCSSSLSSGISQAYQTIKKDNTAVTQRSVINFIGEGVSVADNPGTGATDVTIPYGANTYTCFMLINSTYTPPSGIINRKTPNPPVVSGLVDGQIVSKFTQVAYNSNIVTAAAAPLSFVENPNLPACPFLTLDNETTGEFTLTQDGIYLIEASIHLKPDNTSSIYWQSANIGSFGLGIISTGASLYSGNYQSLIALINSEVDITSSVLTQAVTGAKFRMSLLNFTDRDYDGTGYTSSDVMRFSITKIK